MFLGLQWYWWLVIAAVIIIAVPFKIKFLQKWSKGQHTKSQQGKRGNDE